MNDDCGANYWIGFEINDSEQTGTTFWHQNENWEKGRPPDSEEAVIIDLTEAKEHSSTIIIEADTNVNTSNLVMLSGTFEANKVLATTWIRKKTGSTIVIGATQTNCKLASCTLDDLRIATNNKEYPTCSNDTLFFNSSTVSNPVTAINDICVDNEEVNLVYGACWTYTFRNRGFCVEDGVCELCCASCSEECNTGTSYANATTYVKTDTHLETTQALMSRAAAPGTNSTHMAGNLSVVFPPQNESTQRINRIMTSSPLISSSKPAPDLRVFPKTTVSESYSNLSHFFDRPHASTPNMQNSPHATDGYSLTDDFRALYTDVPNEITTLIKKNHVTPTYTHLIKQSTKDVSSNSKNISKTTATVQPEWYNISSSSTWHDSTYNSDEEQESVLNMVHTSAQGKTLTPDVTLKPQTLDLSIVISTALATAKENIVSFVVENPYSTTTTSASVTNFEAAASLNETINNSIQFEIVGICVTLVILGLIAFLAWLLLRRRCKCLHCGKHGVQKQFRNDSRQRIFPAAAINDHCASNILPASETSTSLPNNRPSTRFPQGGGEIIFSSNKAPLDGTSHQRQRDCQQVAQNHLQPPPGWGLSDKKKVSKRSTVITKKHKSCSNHASNHLSDIFTQGSNGVQISTTITHDL